MKHWRDGDWFDRFCITVAVAMLLTIALLTVAVSCNGDKREWSPPEGGRLTIHERSEPAA